MTEDEARGLIQKSPIFHDYWSSKCQAWLDVWKGLREFSPVSLLNIGPGGISTGDSTIRWMKFWRQMFPSLRKIAHLEIDEQSAKTSRVPERIYIGDVRKIDTMWTANSWDVIFWCQGPEHIYREERAKTFEKLEKVAKIIVMQCPWGSGYDDDPFHYSKDIKAGEFEQFGFKCLYNGKENTRDAGIIAYKVCHERV